MKTIATLSKAITDYVSKKAQLDLLEKEVKANKTVIEDFMLASGELATTYVMESGELFNLKLAEIERTNVNAKQLQENYPDVYADVTYLTAYNRLTVKAETALRTANVPVGVKTAVVGKRVAKQS